MFKIKDLSLSGWRLCYIQPLFQSKSPEGQQPSYCQKQCLCGSVVPGQETGWSQQRWVWPRAGMLKFTSVGYKKVPTAQSHTCLSLLSWAIISVFSLSEKIMHYLPLVLISKRKSGSGPKFMEIKCCQICLSPLGLFHNFIIVASQAILLGNSNIFSAPPPCSTTVEKLIWQGAKIHCWK